eukprot:TRINITY_DN553_c0_g1_i1.p1 TRINITY_DN553_c0_g1~~TRINITY_DN553_c0_g1_i1.p1  ORF type:complete len:288 (-),score=61.08 TRINITY_DN553_c0_g1_i1:55-918(-)
MISTFVIKIRDLVSSDIEKRLTFATSHNPPKKSKSLRDLNKSVFSEKFKSFEYKERTRTTMAEKGSHDSNSRRKNVVIFGKTGAGKSSTINLLKNEAVAKVSNNATGTTEEFAQYDLDDDIRLWDTAGLNETELGSVPHQEAQSRLQRLVEKLSESGGVHLVVWVWANGRMHADSMKNYLFIQEMFDSKVPIVLFVTKSEIGNQWEEFMENPPSAKTGYPGIKEIVRLYAASSKLYYKPEKALESRVKGKDSIRKHSLNFERGFNELLKDWFARIVAALQRLFSKGR